MSNPDNWAHKLRVLERVNMKAGHRVLDYGCGAGGTVRSLVAGGFDASGFDVVDYLSEPTPQVAIGDPARLPYPDDHFDFVVSDQVFEHAMDQEHVFAELFRITRPGGVHFHVIPAKWQVIEPHIYVPFGGLIRSRWWYRLWAAAGIRNEFQEGLSIREITERNFRFAHDGLNYVSTGQYRKMWRKIGFDFRFAEQEFMETSDKARVRKLSRVLAMVPKAAALIRTFRVRIAILQKPASGSGVALTEAA